MRRTLTFFLCLLGALISSSQTYGADEICGSGADYAVYECRVKNICDEYKSEKPVFSSQAYPEISTDTPLLGDTIVNTSVLGAAKSLYRENMGNIYKCGMLQSQRNSLLKIEDFIKQESSGQLSDALGGQIQQRVRRLELSSNKLKCALTDKQTVQNKLNILRETSHQMCSYTSYLEYMKSHYEKINNNAITVEKENDTISTITPRELSDNINRTKNEIAREISHTYKVFPIAYHAYSEYENNFPIHFLLELLRGDFLLLRTALYQNLMPIAQLGLKVINAMSY